MDFKRLVKWMSGAFLSMFVVLAMSAQSGSSAKKQQIIAGPIGKSSSASAKITLVIPPRPDKAKQASAKNTTKPKPAGKKSN